MPHFIFFPLQQALNVCLSIFLFERRTCKPYSPTGFFIAVAIAFAFIALSSIPTSASSAYQTQGGRSIYNDEFSSQTLNPRWRWLNEDESNWRINLLTDSLVIETAPGDMAVDCNNAQNVLLQNLPLGAFEITTKIDIRLRENFQQAGIILMNSSDGEPDQDNYVKIMVLHSSFDGGIVAEFVSEEDGAFPADGWGVLDIDGNSLPAYLKMAGNNDKITGYFSDDGETWQEVGSYTFALSTNAQMGLYAVSGVMAFGVQPTCIPEVPATNVAFDYFHVESTGLLLSSGRTSLENTSPDNTTRETSRDSLLQDEQAAVVEEQETDRYITQRLDNISYAETCTYMDRVAINPIRIGAKNYTGAYDIWANCDDDTIQGVLLLTPDNDALLYLLLVTELPSIYDTSAFEVALTSQLEQTVTFAGNSPPVNNNADESSNLANISDQGRSIQGRSSQGASNVRATSEDNDDLGADGLATGDITTGSATNTEDTPERPSLASTPETKITQPIIIVRVERLNLRSGPGINYERVGMVSQDMVLNVLGQFNNCSWLQVADDNDKTVWLSGGRQFVELLGDCANVLAVEVLP